MQISHLALIPILTSSQNERTGLTAIRYSMTVVSNIAVFLVAWAFFGMSDNASLSSADSGSFRNIMLVVIGLGAMASFVFHVTVKEDLAGDRIESAYQEINSGELSVRDFVQPMSITDWFKEPQFYLVAGVYMSTRLFVNLSQAYLPLYLQESLQLHSKYVSLHIKYILVRNGENKFDQGRHRPSGDVHSQLCDIFPDEISQQQGGEKNIISIWNNCW